MSKWKGNKQETIPETIKRVERRLGRAIKHGSCGSWCHEPERVARLSKVLDALRAKVVAAEIGGDRG